MKEKPADTRAEILQIGRQLMQLYGYNAFSYADISKALNIRNAAVHYHFPGKEDLLIAIIDAYIEQYELMGQQLSAANISAKVKLEKFIERYNGLVEQHSICILGSVASDLNTMPDKVKQRIAVLVELVLGLVERTLKEGKRNGEFNFDMPARTQTLMIMTNLAAGVQLARITGSHDYELIRKGILKQLV